MARKSALTDEDYYNYLLRVYFGRYEKGKELEQAIHYAYLDMNRTLRGFGKCDNKDKISSKSEAYLIEQFQHLQNSMSLDQNNFDNWHRETCEQLKYIFIEGKWDKFYVGQAQKWINMALKYVFVFPKLRPNYQHLYEFCHVPIDNIALEKLKESNIGLPPHIYAWSRIDTYDDYISMQKRIREGLGNQILLDWEFKDWAE